MRTGTTISPGVSRQLFLIYIYLRIIYKQIDYCATEMTGNHNNSRLEAHLRLEPQVERLGVSESEGLRDQKKMYSNTRSFISACEDNARISWQGKCAYMHFFCPIIQDLGGPSPRITAILLSDFALRRLGPKLVSFFFFLLLINLWFSQYQTTSLWPSTNNSAQEHEKGPNANINSRLGLGIYFFFLVCVFFFSIVFPFTHILCRCNWLITSPRHRSPSTSVATSARTQARTPQRVQPTPK